MSSKRRVVITGTGMVSPVGNNVPDSWESIKNGVCGVAPITHYDTSGQKAKLAAEIKDLDFEQHIDKKEIRKMDKFVQFAVIASREAMKQSRLDMAAEDSYRCGVIIASGIGGFGTIVQEHNRGLDKGFDRVSPYFIPMVIANMAAGTAAIEFGMHGMCTSVVTACAGGTNAVGDAFRHIRDGYAEVMLCGGSEACIIPFAIGGFTSMKALNETTDANRASIPFDRERSGFVMGEGAGMLILEEYEHAAARGATIYGEVVGYGSTCDAYHMTAPEQSGKAAAACMKAALDDAGISPEAIDYINAHGTSTTLNDKCETVAVKKVFGDHARKLAISSTKSMTGHLLGAAGAVEAIFCALAIRDGYVPATINYREPDPECDLDVVPNVGRTSKLEYAMSNSLGFGGHNASVILKAYEA